MWDQCICSDCKVAAERACANLSNVFQVPGAEHSRIRADDVQLSKLLHRLLEQFLDFGRFADIGADGVCFGTQSSDLLNYLLSSFGRMSVIDNNLSAAPCHSNGYGGPDAAT